MKLTEKETQARINGEVSEESHNEILITFQELIISDSIKRIGIEMMGRNPILNIKVAQAHLDIMKNSVQILETLKKEVKPEGVNNNVQKARN